MTHIKHRLDEAVEERVPFTLDLDGLVTAERRRRRRLAFASGGGAAVAVVAAVAVTVALIHPGQTDPVGPATGDDGEPDAGPSVVADELPEPDPDVEYLWDLTHAGDPDADLTDAFWEHFTQEWPHAEIDNTDYYLHGEPTGEPITDPPAMWPQTRTLRALGTDSELYSHDYTYLKQDLQGDDVLFTISGVQFQFGDGMVNLVSVEVFPAGSYRIDGGGYYDLMECETPYYNPDSCRYLSQDVTTGPSGETVHYGLAEITGPESGLVSELHNKVVLVLPDGSAVRVIDTLLGPHPGQDDTTVEGHQPALSTEDLIGIAAALPVG